MAFLGGASAFQSDFLFIDLGFEKGTLSGCEFQASGRFLRRAGLCWLRLEVASAVFWGLEIKVPCCSIRGILSIFPSRKKKKPCMSELAVFVLLCCAKKKNIYLFEWVCPYVLSRITEETNLSVLLAKKMKSCCVNNRQENWKKLFYCAIMKQKQFFFLTPAEQQPDRRGNKVIYSQLLNNDGLMYLCTMTALIHVIL